MTEEQRESDDTVWVLVFDAPDQSTAEAVCASLQAEGLRAVLQSRHAFRAAGWLTSMGCVTDLGVLVPHDEVAGAQEFLAAMRLDESEIEAAMLADGITTEEAEAQVR